ncbi:NUDIX domain protein [Jeotgalicoccus aerolatus]|uniref:NUDIX family phosphoesterase n=1 Tax=Jeotgalicoccus aerolatus TaxID=709510 RepID=A0A1G8VAY9_9STAP|nr:NUDIX domain-containing protein [Jeotgalicoccus aerolatus]MBP1951943.1 putative NUDIX family phosphoesterase [Jeotgalicoccus aerolatus]NMA81372.1 NUDIX domain-containing protein [Jeotgalicoccus aerolatus]CAD2074840.1 NUDIX domain protein [Jeotgalicoccus aerolatus]SDJ63064.1 Predicted phosphoesterase, NUDIX family [Jeotgalicoccus aerolatus]GGD93539.1 DNA mismatch repair protein MutT [Jeotgalicoccus aerolatus]
MSKFDEQILVVKRDTLFDMEANAFNGFISKDDNRYKEIVKTFGSFEVKRRGDMEEDPAYKQLISYCIITNDDETLVYKRLEGGGESRLHGLLSIGVGGHMNDVAEEDDIEGKLRINAARELSEEVGLAEDDVKNIEIHGLINDDDNEVGKVHIGLVLKIDVDKNKIINNEVDTIALEWVKNDVLETMSPYESWSELIIRDAYGQ